MLLSNHQTSNQEATSLDKTNPKMSSNFFPLRHILGVILFFSFILTTIITKQQLSWNQETSFRKVIAERTINISRRVRVRSQFSFKNGTYPNLKYARSGPAINCLQKPLTDPANFDLEEMRQRSSKKYAYAWYVSRPAYLCSAIAALKHLKEIRAKQQKGNTTLDVDYVLIYSADNFVNVPNSANDNRTKEMFDIWQREGGILRNFASLSQHLTDNYYKGCYERLYVFQLTEYDRVVIMDADGLAVNDLDHLFWLAMPKDVQIAAPQGYWFKKEGIMSSKQECQVYPTVGLMGAISSVLLLVIPNESLFERSKKYFGQQMKNRGHEYFDMDILNQEFSCLREILVLPKMYGTLDSEYLTSNSRLSSRMSMCKNFSNVHYVHFSGQGKPWSSAKMVNTYLKKYAGPASDVFKRWFVHAHQTCPWLVPQSP